MEGFLATSLEKSIAERFIVNAMIIINVYPTECDKNVLNNGFVFLEKKGINLKEK